MSEHALIAILNQEMDLTLPAKLPFEALRAALEEVVGNLLRDDLNRLIAMLYRVDISERKLKYLLQENVGTDASTIITDLIIARQLEKMASREKYRSEMDGADDDGEERW